ncbi:protein of unknown function [Pararobbsia alpina]|uniref:hypothetical protein n=1 Tax=Pararobbsia alpina TaxID=621374 RepID=UPI0039A541AE
MRVLVYIYWRQAISFAIALAVILSIASFAILPRNHPVNYVASHDVKINHRISPSDLELPGEGAGKFGWRLPNKDEFIGKYVAINVIRKGEAISFEKLSTRLPVGESNVAVWLYFFLGDQNIPLSQLDSGALVLLYQAPPSSFAALVRVHGLVCENRQNAGTRMEQNSNCYAVLETTLQDRLAINATGEPLKISPVP